MLFPGTVLPMTLGRQRSVVAAQAAIRLNRPVGLILQRDPEHRRPDGGRSSPDGTEANLLRYVTSPDGSHHVICQGERRFRVAEFLDGYPVLCRARRADPREREPNTEIDARLLQSAQPGARSPATPAADPGRAGQRGAGGHLGTGARRFDRQLHGHRPGEKQEVLETIDIERRLERVSELLSYRLEVLRLSRQISDQTKETIDERQREFLLREQLKTIQKELGEGEDAKPRKSPSCAEKIAEAKMPQEVEAHTKKELARLERMPEASGEYSMARTYLEWLTELPWSVEFEKAIDIAEARGFSMQTITACKRSSGGSWNSSRSTS